MLETQSKIENYARHKNDLDSRLLEIQKRINQTKEQDDGIRGKRDFLDKEVISLEKEIEESYQEFLSMSKLLESEKETLQKLL